MSIGYQLIEWYNKSKRDLPWRNTKDPYKIWISEIILQQTRVEQGISYYYRFIDRFSDVKSLAIASEEEVLKYWQGLGYYSRARNLHFSAQYINNQLNGIFPTSYQELKQLKGVGDYTAAAIASFAYNEKVALVDGNVYRFLARFYAEDTPIDTLKGKRIFIEIAEKLLENQRPDLFNQAIMEFGALQCKPLKPNCFECIFQNKCMAFEKNLITQFPVKAKQQKIKNRYFNYLHIIEKNSIFLVKRKKNDIWKGLFELPLIETKLKSSLEKLIKNKKWKQLFNNQNIIIRDDIRMVKHQLSHQRLFINFYRIEIENSINNNEFNSLLRIPVNEIEKYPVPKVIENYFNSFFINQS